MNIALVTPYDLAYPGGVTEHVTALAAGLRRRGHDVLLLGPYSGAGAPPPWLVPLSRRVVGVPVAGAVAHVAASPLAFGRLRHLFRRERFDVIHLHEPLTPGLNWWALRLAGHQPMAVTIGTFHAYHEQRGRLYRLGRPLLQRFFNKLDGLIAVSEAARNFSSRQFPGPYQIIPNGIDVQRFAKPAAPANPLPGNGINILFVGRQEPRKGFDTLFEAFVRLKPSLPQLRLHVVGPFDRRNRHHYLELARRRGVTDITFAGYITPKALPTCYHHADIFCAPSTGCESFGIVLLEAMAAHLPVVASDIAGYRGVITHGRNGWLTPPRQPVALAEALHTLATNPALRGQLGRNGYQTAQQHNWDLIIDRTLRYYSDTLASHQPRPENWPAYLTATRRCPSRRQTNYVQRSRPQV
ncbi:MAG: glycosyltransferase family 4 protein [Anaerolineae bacterium]